MPLVFFVLSIYVELALNEIASTLIEHAHILIEHASVLAHTLPSTFFQDLVKLVERLCCQVDESKIELVGLHKTKISKRCG